MKTRRLFLLPALLSPIFARDALAAGTALDVQSGRGTGMAASTTAMIDDSSAIFYNPAGIANGRKLDAQIGTHLIAPSFSFKSSQTGEETKLPFYVVPPAHGYLSSQITEDLAIGIGVFTPFGLKVKWPEDWQGRFLSTRSNLETYYINPTIAYRFGPIRIGAGLQIVRGVVSLSRAIRFGEQEGFVTLGGGTWGVGGNGGIQIDLLEKFLSLGIHYRSAVKLGFDGNAHFGNVPLAFSSVIHDQPVSTSLTQPDTLAMGVAVRPIKDLVIDADVVWLGWGKTRSIDLTFPEDQSRSLNQSFVKNWNNTANVHLGAEGILGDAWRVRGGAMFDPSPQLPETLTPEIPDGSRINLAAGVGYAHDSGIRVDVAYQWVQLLSKTSTAPQLPGEYGGFANILGISVGYATPAEKHAAAEPPMEEPPPTTTPPPVEPAEPATPPPATPPPTTTPEAPPPPPPPGEQPPP